ncbi:hypothetical protein B0H14DRAFT_2591748 [Mycena olivaceomarginata]|nr:hypothetical protein B0H14DRAFT_2591748 [Mycena olivaceomarginata]
MTDAGEDKTFMMKLGKANSEKRVEDGESLWYDRENRRKLIFELLPPLEEGEWLTTDEEYGRPVPDWSFQAPYGSGYSSTKKSLWMYPRERPNPGTKGQEPPVPEVEDLPLKNPGEGGEPFRDVKGAWAHREDSDEDRQIGDCDPDAVSIGSPTPACSPLASMEGVESVPTPPPYKSVAAVTLVPPTAPRLLPQPYDQVLARSAEVPFMPPSTSHSTPVAPARRSNNYRPLQPSSHSLYARQGQLGAPAGPYRSGHPDAPQATQFAPMGAADSTGWEGDVDGLVGGGEEECRGRCRVETSIMRLHGKNGALSQMHLEVGTRPRYNKFVLLTRLRHRRLLDMSMLGPPHSRLLRRGILPVQAHQLLPPVGTRNVRARAVGCNPERSDDAPPPPRARGPGIYAAANGRLARGPEPVRLLDPENACAFARGRVPVLVLALVLKPVPALALVLALEVVGALIDMTTAPDNRALATDGRVDELVVPIRVYLRQQSGGRKGGCRFHPSVMNGVFIVHLNGSRVHEPSADGRSLLERFDDFGNEETSAVSVFQRFDVPLEERIGGEKKHHFRKHNRAKKREKKEADQRAREGREWRERGM